jgi:hypothetical protein
MKIKKVKDIKSEIQDTTFNAKSLVRDKDEKAPFKTSVDDQEKVEKEFKKQLNKIEKFENFTIEIEVKPTDDSEKQTLLGGPESSHTVHDNNMRNVSSEEEVGCGCCDQCNGQEDCECCDDCNCASGLESNPESDVKVMNIEDFIGSLNK